MDRGRARVTWKGGERPQPEARRECFVHRLVNSIPQDRPDPGIQITLSLLLPAPQALQFIGGPCNLGVLGVDLPGQPPLHVRHLAHNGVGIRFDQICKIVNGECGLGSIGIWGRSAGSQEGRDGPPDGAAARHVCS